MFYLDLFYAHFLKISSDFFTNYDTLIPEYATLYFIKEISKGHNHVYQTIIETVNYINNI